jgi:hypothetical protein
MTNDVRELIQPRCGAAAVALVAVLMLVAAIRPAQAITFTTLYNFTDQSGDGSTPYGLAIDASGVLYGVTGGGGALQNGTVFSLTPPSAPGGAWTEATLWSFGGAEDGIAPIAIMVGEHSVLYGITQGGGAYSHGSAFSLTPPSSPGGSWTETVLWSFSGPDGTGPNPGIVADSSGALYGTATS